MSFSAPFLFRRRQEGVRASEGLKPHDLCFKIFHNRLQLIHSGLKTVHLLAEEIIFRFTCDMLVAAHVPKLAGLMQCEEFARLGMSFSAGLSITINCFAIFFNMHLPAVSTKLAVASLKMFAQGSGIF